MKPIPYGRQSISEEDIQAVVNTLRSDFLTQGPQIQEFEKAFAVYVGSQYAVAVSSGTAALHMSSLALAVKPGDKVITTPITFAASANCVRYCGAEVFFADIDPETYLLDIEKVRKILEANPGSSFKGIIPVDFAGRPVDMESFREIADDFGLWVLEDACHAPGGYFEDSNGLKQQCGNGSFADCTAFSFHPVKHITAGEGGMITTNNERLYRKLLMLRTHGITREPGSMIETHGGWHYEMQALGFNYRLSDVHAALALSQLKRAEQGLQKRRSIAATYNRAFSDCPDILRRSGSVEGHAYHLYVIEVENRLGLYDYLRKHNIYAQVHYMPVHLHPYYRELGWKVGDMPHAEHYYKHCISLPMYPTLTAEEQDFVIKKVMEFIGHE